MVTIPDDTRSNRSNGDNWWVTGLLTIVGMLGLWWVQIQQQTIEEVAAADLRMPSGRWILWSLSLIAVGACFGLAVAAGSGWRGRISPAALVWGLMPLAMVASFHLWIGDVIAFPRGFLEVLVGIQMQVASAMAVGLFVAGLLTPLLPRPRPQSPAGA